ncbi:MAG: hypothetical protein PHU88_07345 [candidate division Zixibacteria bacterium]|nr:hypothetical protein [candidate division Zixibacteria bacterium]MDD5425973.1 hypothetical protein [candidate division Zixibacteria bacterium]
MQSRFLFLLCLILPGTATSAGINVELGQEVKIPLPNDWIVATDGSEYPFQLVDTTLSSDIMIFKSDIPHDDLICNDTALKKSVQGVIDEVIMSLPEARILSNTGYFEKYRAGFILEFLSFDTVNLITLQHRLQGIIYRHPDGYQLLFTIWAKSGQATYPAVENSIKLIQGGFDYLGPKLSDVFGARHKIPTFLYVFLFLLLGIFFFMRARQLQKARVKFADDELFWRCECGRLNPLNHKTCRRCGRTKIPGPVVN